MEARADAPVRRIWNPPNPYLSEHRELLEPAEAELEVWEDSSRSILSRNDSPDIHFTWSVNPYRGCFHACAYCYARTTHEYLGLGAGTDFERKLLVKPRAPELLRERLAKPSWKGELIVFSGATDAYQPLEAAWRLTRRCLEVCEEAGNPVSVITKSALVARDADVLGRLAARGLATVAVSIPFLGSALSKAVEPGAPAPARRFDTVRRLAAAGIPVGVAVAPLIPGLNDTDVPGILRRAREAGASSAFRIPLRLPGSVRQVFLRRLEEKLPERARKVENRVRETRGGSLNESGFGKRFRGEGEYWSAVDSLWESEVRRLGYGAWDEGLRESERAGGMRKPPPARPKPRRRRTPPGQLELW
jgi:DNA repair photolyase